jgi:predicted nucleic acid-binding protein
MKAPIIDTCVLVDMLVSTRKAHPEAHRLLDILVTKGWSVRAPAFSQFELVSAYRSASAEGRFEIKGPTEPKALVMEWVDVTADFFMEYMDPSLPHLTAADLVLLCMAKKEERPLVTEDGRLYKAAKSAGVPVYRASEYVAVLETSE